MQCWPNDIVDHRQMLEDYYATVADKFARKYGCPECKSKDACYSFNPARAEKYCDLSVDCFDIWCHNCDYTNESWDH